MVIIRFITTCQRKVNIPDAVNPMARRVASVKTVKLESEAVLDIRHGRNIDNHIAGDGGDGNLSSTRVVGIGYGITAHRHHDVVIVNDVQIVGDGNGHLEAVAFIDISVTASSGQAGADGLLYGVGGHFGIVATTTAPVKGGFAVGERILAQSAR